MESRLLSRRLAVDAVLGCLTDREAVVLANGFVSRDGHAAADRHRSFYMLGSMGLAASIGLGLSLAAPETPVVVLDGDGNLLMGLGVLPMVGSWQPSRFLHLVLDNATYGSTGSQPTLSTSVDFPAMAHASGYRRAAGAHRADDLRRLTAAWLPERGPSLIHVRIDPGEPKPGPRIEIEPPEIARRFAAALAEPEP